LKKFSNKPKEKLRIYKKFATRFNKHFEERRYYLMSRPVFDNAHEYAVLNISNNFYGGMLLSFKKINNEWKELGIIDVWRY